MTPAAAPFKKLQRREEKEKKRGLPPLLLRAAPRGVELPLGNRAMVEVAARIAGKGAGWGPLGSRALAQLLGKVFGFGSPIGLFFMSKAGEQSVFIALLAALSLLSAALLMKLDAEQAAELASARPSNLAPAAEASLPPERSSRDSLSMLSKANTGAAKEGPPDVKAPARDPNKLDSEELPEVPPAEPEQEKGAAPLGKVQRELARFPAFGERVTDAVGAVGMERTVRAEAQPFSRSGLSSSQKGEKGGQLQALRAGGRANVQGRSLPALRGRANRAMGQLKLVRGMSARAAVSGTDVQARQTAADAFDQQQVRRAEVDPVVLDGVGNAPNPAAGGGAAGAVPQIPDVPAAPDATPANVTPYQDQIDQIGRLGDQAAAQMRQADQLRQMAQGLDMLGGMLEGIGIALLAAGAALLAAGAALMAIPMAAAAGAALMAAGAALLAIGGIMMGIGSAMQQQAQQMRQQADQLQQQAQQNQRQADDVAQRQVDDANGQIEQANVAQDCVNQAIANRTNVAACNNPPADHANANVGQAVAQERNAGYVLGEK